jgi:hypothetical protein
VSTSSTPRREDRFDNAARRRRARRAAIKRRRVGVAVALLIVVVVVVMLAFSGTNAPKLTPQQARIVSLAEGQLGYRTDPPNTYCNRFSAYWDAGALDCPNGNRDEQWCADFAAWVWRKAGVQFVYGQVPGEINAASVSFYQWGLAHHSWHPFGSGYVPKAGDVAVYGLDVASSQAEHVAVVTSYSSGARGPDVINGDGERTGFSVVETGTDQYKADLTGNGGQLAGYVSPPSVRLHSDA